MKIMLVVTQLRFGGAETQVVQLARQFNQTHQTVTVVSLMKPLALDDQLKAEGINVHTLNLTKLTFISTLLRFAKLIRSFLPDVVHAHLFHAIIISRLARMFGHIPRLITTTHGAEGFRGNRAVLLRMTDFLTDLNTVVGEQLRKDYLKANASTAARTVVVLNGVNPQTIIQSAGHSHSSPIDQLDQFNWLAVGRLVPAKDYPTLLKAASILKSKNMRFRISIVGDGELSKELRDLAGHLDVAEIVDFLGTRSDVPALMTAADCLVLSSAWEGLPMVLIEAGLLKLPILATDVGDNRHVLKDSAQTCLVPPQSPEHLAQAMLNMMQYSSDERKSMADKVYLTVIKKYDLSQIVKQWLEIYS